MKRAIWLAFLLLTNCGDWLRTPCGCPIGTICQPDPLTPGAMTCGPAPKDQPAEDRADARKEPLP